MPDLFPSIEIFLVCALVVAVAQLIYATAGFGAGMFAVALFAILLPDLVGAVATLFLLTLVTEVGVLLNAWRQARMRLLLGLLPTTAIGMWLGTGMLIGGDVVHLKRLLGLVVTGAGVWFLYSERRRARVNGVEALERTRGDGTDDAAKIWVSLPTGLAAGVLGGLFGTGGPPVIILLKAYGLGKSAFRATLLWYFLLMSVLRGVAYLQAGVLTGRELIAASWLLPASMAGALLGMAIHRRLPEAHFALTVSVLLILLGGLLVLGGGT